MNVREWALPVYTILMQLAVGGLLVLWVVRAAAQSRFTSSEMDRIIQNPLLVIVVTIFMGMIGAHFHLSRPFHSFLAILNFHTSWLSREILFTILFFLTTAGLWYISRMKHHLQGWITAIGWLAIAFGLLVVYCMANIYILPTQAAWNLLTTILSFFATTLLLGVMTIACLMVLDLVVAGMQKGEGSELHARAIRHSFRGLAILILGAVFLDIGLSIFQIHVLRHGDVTATASLNLLTDIYLPLLILRGLALAYAVGSFGYYVFRMYRLEGDIQAIMSPVYIASLLVFIGEIIGRFLFYAVHIRVGI